MNVDIASANRVAIQPETDGERELVNHLFDAYNSEQETPEDMAPYVDALAGDGYDIQAWMTLDTDEYRQLDSGDDAEEYALVVDARESGDER